VVWTLEDGRGKRRRGWKTAWGFVWAGGGKAVEDLLVLGATTAGFLVTAFNQRFKRLEHLYSNL
jgi:hypothetical protein